MGRLLDCCASISVIIFLICFDNCYSQTSSFVCPQPDGQFADETDCHIFYQCENNHSYRQFCPPGSKYDGGKHHCINRYEKVNCGPQPATAPPPTTTPDPNASTPCDQANCILPSCFCSKDGTAIPGNLTRDETPQMVMITFDGAVNHLNFDTYNTIFTDNRTNPNDCKIRGTFFMTHDYNDYSKVQELYRRKHEMAVASVSRRQGLEDVGPEEWAAEMVTMREILKNFATVYQDEVIGMRAPHIKPGRNAQYEVISDYGFVYDSSMVVPPKKMPIWPYTLDHSIPHECKSGTCPTGTFPGVWEIPLNSHYEDERYSGAYCPYLDQCGLNFFSEDDAVEWLKKDFHRHYDKNRAPYMIAISVNWFTTPSNHRALLRFIDYTLSLPDVYYTTMTETVRWMMDPKPLFNNGTHPEAFDCSYDAPALPCEMPKICPVLLNEGKEGVPTGSGGTRYMSTCAKLCPNVYPWVGDAKGKGRGQKDVYTKYK